MLIPDCGFIDGMPADAYHAVPALSKSGVGLLVDDCPDAYWWQSPFNPDYEADEKASFDIGTACHLAMLEPDLLSGSIIIIDAGDYKTKAAQEARDAAYEAGKTPLLPKQVEQIEAMRDALLRHPLAKHAFRKGIAERSHFWTDPETGVLCKCRPDFESADGSYVVDYKTATSANPKDFGRAAREHYYFVQHPWYLEGIKATSGRIPNFLFVVQEKKPPYRVSVIQIADSDIEKGRIYSRKARHVFAECRKRNYWPGYTDKKVATITLPNGFQYDFAEREEAGEFEVTQPKQRFNSRKHSIAYQAQSPEEIRQ